MPRKKPVQIELEGTLHLGLHNPDYTGKTSDGPLPVERPSVRSVHWSQLNPAWLVQECLNRGVVSLRGRVRSLIRHPIHEHWEVTCYLGHPSNHPRPGCPEDWTLFLVSDAEVEAGEMAQAAA